VQQRCRRIDPGLDAVPTDEGLILVQELRQPFATETGTTVMGRKSGLT
jgi:hypothetical protein